MVTGGALGPLCALWRWTPRRGQHSRLTPIARPKAKKRRPSSSLVPRWRDVPWPVQPMPKRPAPSMRGAMRGNGGATPAAGTTMRCAIGLQRRGSASNGHVAADRPRTQPPNKRAYIVWSYRPRRPRPPVASLGWTVRATTVGEQQWRDTEIVRAYREQTTTVEPGLRWIKNPAALSPVWWEKPERIAALTMRTVVGLLVYGLIQRQVR